MRAEKKLIIPKTIHYCWFGGNPLPELAIKCIESWKKYCPDYEIIEWNEDNFDIHYNDYVREAYEAKKWAFVSDVVRLYALVTYGGIYMDTDVEVLKPIDDILIYDAVSGFERIDQIPTGLMACRAEQPLFMELLHEYDNIHFQRKDGSLDLTTNVKRITQCCLKYGLQLNNQKQTVKGFTLLPYDYLCPKDYETKKINITKNTYTIHHFDGSWKSTEDKYALELCGKFRSFFPKKIASYMGKFVAVLKYRGVLAVIKDTYGWVIRKM